MNPLLLAPLWLPEGAAARAGAQWLLALAVLAWAVGHAPWRAWLCGRPDRQHVFIAGVFLAAVVWSMRIPLGPAASLHFLLATTLTLMHGGPLALLGLAAADLAAAGLRGGNWPVLFLCGAVVPVLFVELWHCFIARVLPRNYWVFFFVTAFAGSGLAFVISGVASAALGLAGSDPIGGLATTDYPVALLLMGFGEATLNGFLLAGMILFHPEWVISIDERTYAAR